MVAVSLVECDSASHGPSPLGCLCSVSLFERLPGRLVSPAVPALPYHTQTGVHLARQVNVAAVIKEKTHTLTQLGFC